MTTSAENGRANQRRRTRKDLLAAAGRLLQSGRTPDMDEVAAEAMVSRATAYRYFPTIESLLVEAPLDGEAPEPQQIFKGDDSTDPLARVEKAEAALHEMTYRNAAQLRVMLAASLERSVKEDTAGEIPIRQNRRTGLIEAALAPARQTLSESAYQNLSAALAMVFGVESMIVFSDVLGMDEKAARRVKTWALRAMVRAALAESSSQGNCR